jgi:hypothetical protein
MLSPGKTTRREMLAAYRNAGPGRKLGNKPEIVSDFATSAGISAFIVDVCG